MEYNNQNRISTDWVKPFINRIFTCDVKKESDTLHTEKLQYINIPLYKYCYVCEESNRTQETIDYNIDNFINDELFFQTPDKFNDPFDCFLGFSQVQVFRDVIKETLKKQKKLTPNMRKAMNQFFNNNTLNTPPIEEIIENDEFLEAIQAVLPYQIGSIGGDKGMEDFVVSLIKSLLNNGNKELLTKLVKGTMTIKDQQVLIDLMFSNNEFKKYMSQRLTSDKKDFIMDVTQRDMKLKVETTPNATLFNGDSEAFRIMDFFQLLLNISLESENISELTDVKQTFHELTNELLEKSRKIISQQCRVTCLSERMDSPLMWSHYANKHYGFCLEYDFTYTMMKRYPDLIPAQLMLFPVVYSQTRPLISNVLFNSKTMLEYIKSKKIPPDMVSSIIYGLLVKSEDWNYEKEWRIFSIDSEKITMKLPPARKVFLGSNMENSARERIIDIAEKKNIPVYQMILAADRYKFDYYKVI